MTISLDSLTSDPVGTENGLVTRNIPSGTQDVSVTNFPSSQLVNGEITADQGAPNTLENAWPVELTDGYNVLGTPTDPIRIDPTGTTTQPISGMVTANAGSGTFAVGGTVTANIGTTGGLALDATLTGGTAKFEMYDGSNVIGTSAHPVKVDPTGTTTQPVSGTITANAGSGTFTVGGTVTSNQGAPNSLSNAWPVEVTDGYGNILGTTTNPVITKSGAVTRTSLTFVGFSFNGVGGTETMITLTPYSNFVAGTAGTSFTVDTGKTLRLQSIILTSNNSTGFFRLRVSSSGAVTTSTPVIMNIYVPSTIVNIPIPGGLELTGSVQFGVSQVSTNTGSTFSLTIVGYEY